MSKAILLASKESNRLFKVFKPSIIEDIKQYVELHEVHILDTELELHQELLNDVEFIFSTWGMPTLTEEEIKIYFPNLKAVFYGAGSVANFAKPYLNLGIKVTSSWLANAVPVAEWTVSQILLANKGFFQCYPRVSEHGFYETLHYCTNHFPGNYRAKVGLLGVGAIGSLVVKMLKVLNINIEILVYQPFLSNERACELGVQKASLLEVFSTCHTISNHMANNDQTYKILDKELFNLMLPTATFINTGRGEQVVEEDLIAAMKKEPSRVALIDVTHPEPPKKDSELYQMKNIIVSPHIAGSMGNELERMAQYAVDEMIRYLNKENLMYEVNLDMLKTMA